MWKEEEEEAEEEKKKQNKKKKHERSSVNVDGTPVRSSIRSRKLTTRTYASTHRITRCSFNYFSACRKEKLIQYTNELELYSIYWN